MKMIHRLFTETGLILFLSISVHAFAQPPSGSEYDILTSVHRSESGQYLIGGYTSSFEAMETTAIISLLDSEGNSQWTSIYDSEYWDEAADVMIDNSGNCWLAGATRLDGELFDWLVCKYSESGLLQWTQAYQLEYPSAAVEIVSDGFDGAYIAGYLQINEFKQIGVIHIEPSGDLDWSYITDFDLHYNVQALERNQNGSLIIAGQQNNNNLNASDIYIAQISTSGELEWESYVTLPSAQHCTGLCITSNGEIAVTAFTVADTVTEQTDGLLLKMSDEGDLLWQRTIGDLANDRFTDVTAVNGDSLLVCGVTQDPVTLNKYAALYLVNGEGDLVWTRTYGFDRHAEFRALDGVSSTDFMAVGFADTEEAYMTDYLIATASTANAPEPVELPSDINAHIFPNPSNAQMTLELTLPRADDLSIVLSNILGQQLATVARGHFTAGVHRLPISLNNVASGSYFVEIDGSHSDAKPLKLSVVK
jgi:Secretion system C-terminal sorting domain